MANIDKKDLETMLKALEAVQGLFGNGYNDEYSYIEPMVKEAIKTGHDMRKQIRKEKLETIDKTIQGLDTVEG